MHPGIEALKRANAHWNAGDIDGYLELYREDFVMHGLQGAGRGREGFRAFLEGYRTAFADCGFDIDDIFAVDDKVTMRFTGRVRMASGRELSFPGITILRFEGDKCVERWSQADFMSLLQDMGVMPKPN